MNEQNREPIIVVGHRNPDNDSICSAVGYARLKHLLNPTAKYVAMRTGPIPPESAYVLDRFGLPHPPVLTHVHSRVRDAMTPNPLQITEGATMREAGETLKRHSIRTLVVNDSEGRYAGIIDTTTFANLYLAELDDTETETAMGAEKDAATMAVARKRITTLTQPVSTFLSRNAPVLEAEDILNDARETVLASALRQAIVLDEDGHATGILTRTDLARTPRRRVILVDHNESSQAVSGIGEAEVIEVVDHHRIGDIQTATPIPFINLPLGSTASIVASEYQRHDVTVEPAYAAVLLSALLTDTVLLKSPTTTVRDHELASLLANAAGLEVETFGRELFEARFAGQDGSVEGIVSADSKVYLRGDSSFVISQYETVNMNGILAKEGEIAEFLNNLVQQQGHEFALALITDITREGSQFIIAGKPHLVEHSFNISFSGGDTGGCDSTNGKSAGDGISGANNSASSNNSVWVPGILSRKKQVAPRLLD
ncbi:MAG: putative manganese-dependent inorganic diphosphatase [Coriobacteriales bacterium]|nr:putative manganese-dependent inorganic diphosphatase [Coriobacteriales bacterium]